MITGKYTLVGQVGRAVIVVLIGALAITWVNKSIETASPKPYYSILAVQRSTQSIQITPDTRGQNDIANSGANIK